MIIRSESLGELAKALVEAQKATGKAHKGADNPFFKSKYANLEAVLDTILGPLNDNGIALTQLIGGEDGKAGVTTILMHVSGEFIGAEALAPIVKQDAQSMGSAYTYLRRYGASSAVGLIQSDDDGNAATRASTIADIPAHQVEITGGMFKGMTLGELAAQNDPQCIGHVRWLATNKSNGELMNAKALEVWEKHKPDYTDNQVNDYLADADTKEELSGLWRCLTKEQHVTFKDAFAARKDEVTEVVKRTTETARG